MNSLIERVKTAMVGIGTGWILVLMLLLSIVSLAIMLERTWLYWSLRDDVEGGLVESEHGVEAAQEAMEGASALQRMKLEKRLAYLGTVGNNAPFIGLLGTVIGILAAFDELSKGTLAQAAGSTGGASQQVANQALMGRISEALVATAIGHLLLAHLKAIPLPAGEATADAAEGSKADRTSARKDPPEDSERN